MIKDITFGQYLSISSPLHRLDARIKLVLTVAFIVMLFSTDSPYGIGITILFCVMLFAIAHVPIKMAWRSIKPIIPIIIFTSLLNMFFLDGDPLITIWKITVTKQGVLRSVLLSLRIVCLIAGSSLLTYTTTPIELTDAIERLFSPLKRIGLPVHEFAMMMSIALRFIPTLIEETDKIMSAQKSRGAELDTGTFSQRIKALVPVLVPLFISAFRRADELALAMECRCYRGGDGRTRLRQPKLGKNDAVAVLIFAAVFAAVLLTSKLLPPLF